MITAEQNIRQIIGDLVVQNEIYKEQLEILKKQLKDKENDDTGATE